MLLLCCLVVISYNFGVDAYIPIAIGEDNILPANKIASTPVWHIDPPEPSFHPGYNVTNVGKSAIQASIYWKDSWPLQADDVFCEAGSNCGTNSNVNIWYQLSGTIQIDPSESAIIKPSENLFYFTRLVVVSKHPKNSSIVNVNYETEFASHLQNKRSELYWNNILKDTLRYGSRFSGIDGLVKLFWPKYLIDSDVWNEVRDYVRYLIDPETSTYINTLLNGRLMAIKLRLTELAREMEQEQSEVSFHYMNIAQDLIGLETEFVIRNHHNAKKLNFDLLPLYSNVVLMKAAYYVLGLRCEQKIYMYLYGRNRANIQRYFNDTIRSPQTGANQYILEVFKSQQNQSVSNEYDRIMSAQNAMIEQGYVPIWNNMMDRPGKTLVDSKITYSQLIGEQNDGVLKCANGQPSEPLTPSILSTGRFNRLRSLTTYLSSSNCFSGNKNSCIHGLKLTYENGAEYTYVKDKDESLLFSARRVVELNDYSRISSLIIQQVDENEASLSVAVQRREVNRFTKPTYYELGLVDSNWANVSLEIPYYKVASIFPAWSNRYGSLALAVSFTPTDPSISLSSGFPDAQC